MVVKAFLFVDSSGEILNIICNDFFLEGIDKKSKENSKLNQMFFQYTIVFWFLCIAKCMEGVAITLISFKLHKLRPRK